MSQNHLQVLINRAHVNTVLIVPNSQMSIWPQESFGSYKFETELVANQDEILSPLWAKSVTSNYFSASLILVRINDQINDI